MLRDFDREGEADFHYCWDEERAQNIVDWFALLRHSKGVLAGQPIVLTDWQKFFLCQIYGWRRLEDGRRRFKKSFVECGRKNAKSQTGRTVWTAAQTIRTEPGRSGPRSGQFG